MQEHHRVALNPNTKKVLLVCLLIGMTGFVVFAQVNVATKQPSATKAAITRQDAAAPKQPPVATLAQLKDVTDKPSLMKEAPSAIWPMSKNGDVAVNEAANLVAVQNGKQLEVWTLLNGVATKKKWTFSQVFPTSVPLAFCWSGSQLLVSFVKSSVPVEEMEDVQWQEALASPGETHKFDLDDKSNVKIFDQSYWQLKSSRSGRFVVAASPSHKRSEGAVAEFYELSSNGAKILGNFKNPQWSSFSEAEPYIIGWDAKEEGVLVVARDFPTENEVRRSLFHIDKMGKAKSLLSAPAEVLPEDRYALPLTFVAQDSSVAVQLTYFNQAFYYSTVSEQGINKRFDDRIAFDLMKDKVKAFQIVAMTPDQKLLVLQQTVNGVLQEGTKGDVWVLDVQNRRRREVGSFPAIEKVYQWLGRDLLVGVSVKKEGRIERPLALLKVGAEDQKGQSTNVSWENIVTPLAAPAQAATDFLRQPGVVAVELPTQWKARKSAPADLKGFTLYSLPTLKGGEKEREPGFIALDPKTNRVAAFQVPRLPVPQPEQPLSAEQARQKAEQFLRGVAAEAFAAPNPAVVQISPLINKSANYTFRVQRALATPKPTWAEVEVRASDGKIASYRAQVAASDIKNKGAGEISTTIADEDPRLSPDGKRMAFLSNRTRPGYPKWWPGRGYGLFVIDSDGRDFRNLAPVASRPIAWSPDSRYIAYNAPSGTQVYDFETKQNREVPAPQSSLVDARLFAWSNSQQLLLGWVHNGPGACDLMGWNPQQPLQTPTVLVKDWSNQVGNDWGAGSFDLSGDGKTLYFTWLLLNDTIRDNRYGLYSLSPNALDTKPQKIAELPVGDSVQWLKRGIYVSGWSKDIVVDFANTKVQTQELPSEIEDTRERLNALLEAKTK